METEPRFTIAAPADRSLPREKLTRISWNDLVEVIATNEVSIADHIRHDNPGTEGRTEHLSGDEMLQLWKDVERKKLERAQSLPESCPAGTSF
jgi:hypothetical protein